MSCKICEEKDKELRDRDKQIARILKAYARDKKIYLITIGVLILLCFYTIAYGGEGLGKVLDIVKSFWR